MWIFSNTPTDVARARIASWQRDKELEFLADMDRLVARHQRRGLEKRRIVRVITLMAKGLLKVGLA